MATKKIAAKKKAAGKKVGAVMHEFKRGKLKSSSGGKVTNPKQAIAIGLSEARAEGDYVKPRAAAKKKTAFQAKKKN